MITTQDIQNLASLARIEISDEEAQTLTVEVDSILGYVGQVTSQGASLEHSIPPLRNVMRDDIVTHTPREYTEDILKNAPAREKDYLKVKKIL